MKSRRPYRYGDPCDASGAISNGAPGPGCTANLAHGTSCTPSCNTDTPFQERSRAQPACSPTQPCAMAIPAMRPAPSPAAPERLHLARRIVPPHVQYRLLPFPEPGHAQHAPSLTRSRRGSGFPVVSEETASGPARFGSNSRP